MKAEERNNDDNNKKKPIFQAQEVVNTLQFCVMVKTLCTVFKTDIIDPGT